MELENFRNERLEDLAALIQKVWRGWKWRRRFKKMRSSQIILARSYRCWKVCSSLGPFRDHDCMNFSFPLPDRISHHFHYSDQTDLVSSLPHLSFCHSNCEDARVLSRILSRPLLTTADDPPRRLLILVSARRRIALFHFLFILILES